MSLISFIFILLSVYACDSRKVNYPADLTQLHENLISYYLVEPIDYAKGEQLLRTLDKNGSWSDIDYSSKRRGGWPVKEHLENVQIMAIAYRQKGSDYYQRQSFSKKIHLALNYWLKNDFLSTNWWDQHIGVPELLSPTLFLMEDELSAEQLNQALVLLRRAQIKMTGQNKVWLSGNVLFRSLLTRDADSIAMASNSIQEEVKVTNGEGIQFDWSYHQHGAQLQFGNYGLSYIEDMIRWYRILDDTPFHFEENKAAILRNYLLEGQRWVIWKDKMDVSANGRHLFIDEPAKKFQRLKSVMQEMSLIDEAYAEEYQEATDYKTLSGNKHFWCSDFHVHRTNDYYFSVKMCSNRVLGAETVNQENIQGYHMGDGVALLYQSNQEYENIFPFWDWKKLPGTTIIQDTAALPYLTAWGYHIESDFVGGVSDGTNGIATMHYNRDGLTANKSWFMFDDKVVCLGSGINAKTEFPVATTINQVFLEEEVLVGSHGNISKIQQAKTSDDTEWILHDHVGYLFPYKGSLKAQTKMLEGSWNRVAKRYRPIILTDEIFSLWIDHGANPKDASYEYILVPRADQHAMVQLNKCQPFKIVNEVNLQTVQSSDNSLAGAVFYTPGKANINGGIEVDEPCILMTKRTNEGLQLSLSDPTHLLEIINVTITGAYIGEQAILNSNKTSINLTLPQGGDAGKTITVNLKSIK